MKFALTSLLLATVMISTLAANQTMTPVPASSVTPSPPIPPPSATAAPFVLPPTSTPTATPVVVLPALPVLQNIHADNIDQVQPLFSLECMEPNAALLGVDAIRHILWSPTENVLASVIYGGICLYDLDMNGNAGMFIEARDTWAAVFSPDGATLATLHNGNKSVRLWDTNTWDEIPTTLEAGYNIQRTNPTLAYSPDGKFIATATYRGGLRLYDAETEALLVRVRIPSWAVYFNGDGTRLITLNNDGVGLWTLHAGPRLFRDEVLPIGNRAARDISILMLGKDSSLLYYSTFTTTTGSVVYDFLEGQQIEPPDFLDSVPFVFLPDDTPMPIYENSPSQFLSPGFTNMGTYTFSPDGRLLATIPLGESYIIQLWGVPS